MEKQLEHAGTESRIPCFQAQSGKHIFKHSSIPKASVDEPK